MRRSGAAAARSRPAGQRIAWRLLAPRLLLDIAPRTPPCGVRERLLGRVLGRVRGRVRGRG